MWNIDCVNYCKSALVILRVNLTERTFACFFFNFCRNVTELHHHSPLSGFPSLFSSVLSSDAATLPPCTHFLVHVEFGTFAAFLRVQWNTISRQPWWTKLLQQVSARYGDTRHTTHTPHRTGHTNTNVHCEGCGAELKAKCGFVCVPRSLFGSVLQWLLSDQVQAVWGSALHSDLQPGVELRVLWKLQQLWVLSAFLQALATSYSDIINCAHLKDCVKALIYL